MVLGRKYYLCAHRLTNRLKEVRKLLLCDEAIAQAAIDAGLSGMYAYPGTPSTEIMEYIQTSEEAAIGNICREWSSNEKTAVEAAMGMSYSGKRAMVAMKHVGMNVAADGFMNVAVTGVNGGLIIVAADDPSMHSSQNEQDSRYYANFAKIPCFEPSNQQEAYDMVFDAFELSERLKTPVIFRIVTRLAHSRAEVTIREKKCEQNEIHLPEDKMQFILLPAVARRQNKRLIEKYDTVRYDTNIIKYNDFIDGDDTSLGVISTGIAFNYLMENYSQLGKNYPILKVGAYPISKELLYKIFDKCDSILVLEDGYPLLEEGLCGLLNRGNVAIHGRLDGTLPRDGELTPTIVAKALGLEQDELAAVSEVVKARPPQLCKGCSHADTYRALNEAVAALGFGRERVFADIGCYTLGAGAPFNAICSTVDMGASITMALGASDAGLTPTIAFIGDSTFTHSGMTGLLDAVGKNAPITVIISDNSTTAMTGGQKSQATGKLVQICMGLGVAADHIRVILPLPKKHDENVEIMKEEFAYQGVSVIISQRECIQTAKRKLKK